MTGLPLMRKLESDLRSSWSWAMPPDAPSALMYMYWTAGSSAALLIAWTAFQRPTFWVMLPPETRDMTSGWEGVDCSVMLILDMSITITPDLGSAGAALPAAAIEETKPMPRMKAMTPARKRPQITAKTILTNSFMFGID